jgi:hypothetical protein
MLLALCITASGCGGSTVTTPLTPAEVAERYGYNTATSTMTPAYALVPEYRNPLDGYARDLLARECLQGVVDYQVVRPVPGDTELEEFRTGQAIFNEGVALRFGYPIFRAPATNGLVVDESVTMTEDILTAMKDCGKAADKRLGLIPDNIPFLIESAGWEAAATDPLVMSAASAWKACMAPLGIADLPEVPDLMPPPSMFPRWAVDEDGNYQGYLDLALTDKERDVAVADARCRGEAHYDEVRFKARVVGELQAIAADPEGFEAARTEFADYFQGISEVISALG